jgi:hypothetical protein
VEGHDFLVPEAANLFAKGFVVFAVHAAGGQRGGHELLLVEVMEMGSMQVLSPIFRRQLPDTVLDDGRVLGTLCWQMSASPRAGVRGRLAPTLRGPSWLAAPWVGACAEPVCWAGVGRVGC